MRLPFKIISIAAVFLIVGIFLFGSKVEGMIYGSLMAKGNYFFNGGSYDLDRAQKYYKLASFFDQKASSPHYQQARVNFMKSNYEDGLSEIEKSLALNPENKRAYYIRGLINGYNENYKEAVTDFQKFIEWSPREWAGYNDLAWAYYEDNDFQNAVEAAQRGLDVAPGNAWLLNGLGVSYQAMGEDEKAKEALDKSSEIAKKMTTADWTKAYPGNDAQTADWDLAQFRTDVNYNLDLASKYSFPKSGKGKFQSACGASYQNFCSGSSCSWGYCDPDCGTTGHVCDSPYPACGSYCGSDCDCAHCGNGICDCGETCDTCDCGPCCTDSSWSPDPSTICLGVSFTQTSNCGHTRGATGTATCNGACGGANGGAATCTLGSPLCSSVFGSSAVSPPSPWSWTCFGVGSGHTDAFCSHDQLVVNVVCGGAAASGSAYCPGYVIPESAKCEPPGYFTSTSVSESATAFTWSCNSTCNGSPSGTCTAGVKPKYKGECGSLNGDAMCNNENPVDLSNACATPGAAIILHESEGPYDDWVWKCLGSCDADSPQCTAKGTGSCGWIETN